jgi:hypothetical protein
MRGTIAWAAHIIFVRSSVRASRMTMSLATILAACSAVWAKGDMVRIEVKGWALVSPIQITDPYRLEEFTFYGDSVSDWKAGIVAQHPIGLPRYEISFYMGCRTINSPECLADKPRLAYVLFYEYDSSSRRGFVCLPGKRERSLWEIDSGTLYRGPAFEGHWFSATDSWTDFVRPLIALLPPDRKKP